MVKSKENKKDTNLFIKTAVAIAYFVIWSLAMYDFLTVTRGDEMGVSILYLFILLPIITLIASIFVGREKRNNLKWFMIIFFAIMYFIPILTWEVHKFSDLLKTFTGNYHLFVIGIMISTLGMIFGTMMQNLSDKAFRLTMLIGTFVVILIPIIFIAISSAQYGIDFNDLADEPIIEELQIEEGE